MSCVLPWVYRCVEINRSTYFVYTVCMDVLVSFFSCVPFRSGFVMETETIPERCSLRLSNSNRSCCCFCLCNVKAAFFTNSRGSVGCLRCQPTRTRLSLATLPSWLISLHNLCHIMTRLLNQPGWLSMSSATRLYIHRTCCQYCTCTMHSVCLCFYSTTLQPSAQPRQTSAIFQTGLNFSTSPSVQQRSIVMSVSVCLSVRSHISTTTCANFVIFFSTYLTVSVARSVLLWRQCNYAMYFRFCGRPHICPWLARQRRR